MRSVSILLLWLPLWLWLWPWLLPVVDGRKSIVRIEKNQQKIVRTEPEDIPKKVPVLKKRQRSILERHPYASAITITTCNAVAADLVTQLALEGTEPWDRKRTAMFALFGFLVQGCAQYASVNLLWERLFPGKSMRAVLSKMAAMNLLSDTLFFFPCFYIFKEIREQGTLGLTMLTNAMKHYRRNYVMDWRNSWLVWFPGHVITYGVMPPHNRIPWMSFLSFFYMCVLSLTRGSEPSTKPTKLKH